MAESVSPLIKAGANDLVMKPTEERLLVTKLLFQLTVMLAPTSLKMKEISTSCVVWIEVVNEQEPDARVDAVIARRAAPWQSRQRQVEAGRGLDRFAFGSQ